MLFHRQQFFAQIWLGALSGDTKGIIIRDQGLAPSSVEVIENGNAENQTQSMYTIQENVANIANHFSEQWKYWKNSVLN